ncbi:MAG: UDP-N-acetylmuramoylalanine-D-glutamate ligase, UDP-N-acetylmuramoylalanine-D-glutamate ligase [Candidatus Peregrinibacteria bacterium GW2011_GWE2_39_6]|nr:MAG: UDP-N-acetylmuramoylalanine-D-glutamate ligase, UDP-N-acetylmuramoylalanine-D-glutamate ligase [Candidatus Peregrinibacteria bacterium GW2011_GWF2_39_17]KKR26589.1 MAG: UDP-N-acetylmuramoylalanine-D-glutamate ligase, UDP-N-acetylmuramoylalanine-D-glutamate ligase [Candidatus Peregrinibacteria bacterium GW2011_GWE2_39_6]HCW32505.1 UDP-N-acetylmuramoyl-L-alanine--D-glutamate ligase [Candidatus Peregrinibacteria bacterium]
MEHIAILGLGIEGKSLLKFWQKRGAKITLCDENETLKIPTDLKSVNLKLGQKAFKNLKGYDLIFKSPGIYPGKINNFPKATSLTSWFFDNCPCPIIGVTGTKGKGTTATLIYRLLKAAHLDVYLGGNIGTPPLDFWHKLSAKSLVVLELSSFQLQTLKKSPHLAVILNITSDHLDYHASIKEYRDAKANIIKYQTKDDFVIANADYQVSNSLGRKSKGTFLQISTRKNIKYGAQIKGDDLILKPEIINSNGRQSFNKSLKIIPIKKVGLLGKHNLENILPAIAVASLLDVSPSTMRKVISDFKGLPHRLEPLGVKKGVDYYNDSFSTTPETSIAAIQAFQKPLILIAGGSEKHSNFKDWAKVCATQKNLKVVILTGKAAANRMADNLKTALEKQKSDLQIFRENKLKQAMALAITKAKKGDVILLSPACASFEEFANYKIRGEKFKKLFHKGI